MIECRAIGPVELVVNGSQAPPDMLWRKNIALLVYLAESPNRTCSREHLVDLLWPGKPHAAARHSLRESLRVVRKHAGKLLVESDTKHIHLLDGAVRMDTDLVTERVDAEDWVGAAELIRGAFMEGFNLRRAPAFMEWLEKQRARWRTRSVQILESAARSATAAGQTQAAERFTRMARDIDPDALVEASASTPTSQERSLS